MDDLKIVEMRREIAYMLGAEPVMIEDAVSAEIVRFGEDHWYIDHSDIGNPKFLLYDKNFAYSVAAIVFLESMGYRCIIDGNTCLIQKPEVNFYSNAVAATKQYAIFKSVYDAAKFHNSKKK